MRWLGWPHVANLVALEIFDSVENENSISQAIRKLQKSQPAEDARMRSKEAVIGIEPLIESSRQVDVVASVTIAGYLPPRWQVALRVR